MSTKSKKHDDKLAVHPKVVTDGFVFQKLEDELLIYDLHANRAVCLNQTAALVWQNCDGKSSAGKIAQKLEKKLGAPVNEELVMFAVSELKEKGLLENGGSIANNFKGLSRREVVKKVGFASLVSLPIVSSIVAPVAAEAQSLMEGAFLINCTSTPGGSCIPMCSRAGMERCAPGLMGEPANCDQQPMRGVQINCQCICVA